MRAHDQPPRVVFAGTPEFAVPTLEALLGSHCTLVAVHTQPDRPAGRGRQPRASPVKLQALEAGLPVYQPRSLRDAEARAELAALQPDLMVVVAYGLILPRAVLATPALGCINVHASLLPRWRGAAPIQRAVLAGDRVSGVSLMRMDAGLDTGPVLARAECPISPGMTAGELHDRLAQLGALTLARLLPDLFADRVRAEPQDPALACYADKLDKAEAELDWSHPAPELERRVRAFNPWPVAQTRVGGQPLRIWRALAEAGSGEPGRVLAEDRTGIRVATGQGILRLTEIQAPGKRPMTAADYLNAHSLLGQVLGQP